MTQTELTTKEILDLAYDDGLQVLEENGYKGSCDYVLSYKEYLKDMGLKDNNKNFKGYKTSLEFCTIIRLES